MLAEAGLARVALAEAREREQVTWSELAARAEVGSDPVQLAAPAAAPAGSAAGASTDVDRSTLARAIQARATLASALLNLDAARGRSRWSLVATAAQEGEEDVARLGVGYRLPLSGQKEARTSALEAAIAEQLRSAELERARLEGRLRGARARAAGLASGARSSPGEIEGALAALETRVTVGRDRLSTVLPLRRRLVGALLTELGARAAYLRAELEILTLSTETP